MRLRKQLIKNYFCYLFFSAGTPMALGGDEFMRTQRGNNNAYCQNNEISWLNWEEAKRHSDILEFFKKTIAFTRRHTILQRRKFFLGRDLEADHLPDITWYGKDLGRTTWDDCELRTLCFLLDGGEERSELGDYHLFLIFNADPNLQYIRIPPSRDGQKWYRVIDTSLPHREDFLDPGQEILLNPPDFYLANPRSTVVLLGK
jgi:glycogen operon protein